MAKTLLSGANIVYNGNPLNDLSLTAFLDKFMEKKPKQTTWHGGSQIEPAKKLDMNRHLIGAQILSLAEDDVPPEDLIFHKFYMNKMSTTTKPKKKKKKKKKGAQEEEAEDLYGGGGGEDESDNEEIENMLDATEPTLAADGDYDYDDLDNIANEDDDDLIGDVSDNEMEMEIPSDSGEEGEDVANFGSDDDDVDIGDADDISDDDIDIGQADDEAGDDDDDAPLPVKGKRKSGIKSSASPFASLEEYEHLLDDVDDSIEEEPEKKDKVRSRKKRKPNQNDDDIEKPEEKSEKRRKPKKKKSKTLN